MASSFLSPSNINNLISKFSGSGGGFGQKTQIDSMQQNIPGSSPMTDGMGNIPGKIGEMYRQGKIQTMSGRNNMMTPQNQSQPSYQPNFQPNYQPSFQPNYTSNFNTSSAGATNNPMTQQQDQNSPIGPSSNMMAGITGITGGMQPNIKSSQQSQQPMWQKAGARLSNAFRSR